MASSIDHRRTSSALMHLVSTIEGGGYRRPSTHRHRLRARSIRWDTGFLDTRPAPLSGGAEQCSGSSALIGAAPPFTIYASHAPMRAATRLGRRGAALVLLRAARFVELRAPVRLHCDLHPLDAPSLTPLVAVEAAAHYHAVRRTLRKLATPPTQPPPHTLQRAPHARAGVPRGSPPGAWGSALTQVDTRHTE